MPNPTSPGKSTPQMLRIKLTDLADIDRGAKALGLTRASFIRQSAILRAREVMAEKEWNATVNRKGRSRR